MEQTVREFVRTHPMPAFLVGLSVILAASIKGSGVLLAMAIVATALTALLTLWRRPLHFGHAAPGATNAPSRSDGMSGAEWRREA